MWMSLGIVVSKACEGLSSTRPSMIFVVTSCIFFFFFRPLVLQSGTWSEKKEKKSGGTNKLQYIVMEEYRLSRRLISTHCGVKEFYSGIIKAETSLTEDLFFFFFLRGEVFRSLLAEHFPAPR